jgi:uncharacterized protein
MRGQATRRDLGGRRQALTNTHLIAAFFALPFVTLKVVWGIHDEAARLWLKGRRSAPSPTARKCS